MISASKLEFLVGTREDGLQVYGDFARTGGFVSTGHVGSGHASFDEGAFVVGLLQRYPPSELKFAMVDPKQVQLTPYEGIPHLLRPIAYTPDATRELIESLLREVDVRRDALQNAGAGNLGSYNQGNNEKLPAIILIIPEIADLMMIDRPFYEKAFIAFAQESRKVGVYLYIATQRPSTDILTDALLDSIPGRIVFEVTNKLDGERLLGEGQNAEHLGRQGRLIYKDEETAPVLLQAPYVSDDEIDEIVKLQKSPPKPMPRQAIKKLMSMGLSKAKASEILEGIERMSAWVELDEKRKRAQENSSEYQKLLRTIDIVIEGELPKEQRGMIALKFVENAELPGYQKLNLIEYIEKLFDKTEE